MAASDPAVAQVVVPTETSPLLADRPPVDAEEAGDASVSRVENGADDATADGQPQVPVKDMGTKAYALLPAIAIGIFLGAVDQLITVASYAKMGSELNALNSVSWIATSYLLTLTSCQPLYGKLSDIFGRKECLLFAYSVFGVGCLGCGLAQSMLQLCLSRAVTGVGGAGMTSVVSILISDLVPLRDRGIWQGYINVIYGLGTATGAPLGGFLADSIGWRWAFMAQAPLCAIASLVLYVLLKLPPRPHDHWLDKVKRIDFMGAISLVAAIFAVLVGLDSGSNLGWSNRMAIIPLAVSPALFAIFVYIEMRVASHPFAPGHIIFERSKFACYLANFFGVAGQFSSYFFLPLYFQAVKGYSATMTGALLVPGMAAGVCGSIGSGWLMKKTGKYYWLNVWSFLLLAVSIIPAAIAIYYRSTLGQEFALVLGSIGGYIGVTSTLVSLLANADVQDTAVVVACSYLFRSLGGSAGVGVSSAFLQVMLRSELSRRLPDGDEARKIEERVRQSLDSIKDLEPAVAEQVRSSYQVATMIAQAPTLVFCVLAFVATLWVKQKTMRK